MVEKDLAEIKEAKTDQEIRTCIGFRDNGNPCTNSLSRYLRCYCSGEGMQNAKKNGTYRNDLLTVQPLIAAKISNRATEIFGPQSITGRRFSSEIRERHRKFGCISF